ncbi:MAG TPA: dTDP-4-dehydrorhamnose reductase [Streptosporangiaceae bacterium]|jgi:dTDP-4-dehydrorhamnose reductase
MTGWLVTGGAGMLGRDMTSVLLAAGAQVTALRRDELDITSQDAVLTAVRRLRPQVVVNCAAWTAVDDAESHEAAAMAVNGGGAANLAAACAAVGARLVQVSTDYVFGGTAARPYAEYQATGPRSAYGRTKLAGEQAVLSRLPEAGYVVRTAWLYGAHGRSFVGTMIRLAGQQDRVRVVDDQAGQPTWTADVARQILLLLRSGAEPGIYHATSTGQTTWHGLASEVFRLLGTDPGRVEAIASGDLVRPAPRPAYSVLGHDRWQAAGLPAPPPWRESLAQAFPAITAVAARAAGPPAGR